MKKGFTLAEMLAVIVVLAFVMTISLVSVSSVKNQQLKKVTEERINSMGKAAILYGQDNPNVFLDVNKACSNSTFNETNTPGIINYKASYSDCVVIDGKTLADNEYLETEYINGERSVQDAITGCNILKYNIIIYRDNNRVNSYVAINENACNDEPTE